MVATLAAALPKANSPSPPHHGGCDNHSGSSGHDEVGGSGDNIVQGEEAPGKEVSLEHSLELSAITNNRKACGETLSMVGK